ncbi:prepilin-type N-terminal cleavage/methylation domain-containing protein [Ralstonia sp. RL]|uniref:prepilin-type N-terminal cleavage/methylation domain-containing protein n=1 Tax=Ralstonia sp. RL TaxID=1839756 RepID=UPI00257FD18D|nr:prepilin-type N-terminal cleavage/methylation domain-containing protein [Ralstonia sp. RL]
MMIRIGQRAQRGFSLLELALALAALGLMIWSGAGPFADAASRRDRDAAQAHGRVMLEELRAFALAHARLPCPDTDGDGWEGDAGGACPPGVETGWLPYRTLGLDIPNPRLRAVYGVYRNPLAAAGNADLTLRLERSTPPDASGDPGYQSVRDLIAALNFAAAEPPVATHVYLTGDDGAQGAVDCAGNVRSHPAVMLVMPVTDRDGNGNPFDGAHADLLLSGRCAQAPGTAATATRDDVVAAESLAALAGWLAAHDH